MSDRAIAFLRHKLDGRVRIKIPSKKKNVSYFLVLKEHIYQCRGVKSVNINPTTGSVLIHFTNFEELIIFLNKSNLLILKDNQNAPLEFYETVSSTFSELDKLMLKVTGGKINLGSLAFLYLAIAGIYQVSIGNLAAPAWYTAFWYAWNVFSKSQKNLENNSSA